MTMNKKLAAALAAAGLPVGLSLAWTGTARAGVTPPVGQWKGTANLWLTANSNLLCFEDPSGPTANGAQVQLGHCHPYNSDGTLQRWVLVQPDDRNGNPLTEGGDNVYELYNLAAGRCLGVTGTSVGQPLTLTSCVTTSTSIALWVLRPTDGGLALLDFQLALWLYDDWCIAANDFNDNVPTRLRDSMDATPSTSGSCGTSGSASSALTPRAAAPARVDTCHRLELRWVRASGQPPGDAVPGRRTPGLDVRRRGRACGRMPLAAAERKRSALKSSGG